MGWSGSAISSKKNLERERERNVFRGREVGSGGERGGQRERWRWEEMTNTIGN